MDKRGNMDLSDREEIAALLSKHHLWSNKRLGQNFLVNKSVLEKIVETADLSSKDYVLEIGPGIGTLTQKLCEKARWVLGIEVDPNMIKILKETCGSHYNLKIIQRNILAIDLSKHLSQLSSYKVVANIPYYITQPVLRNFLETQVFKPETMILMVQKEVAEKICAKKGKMSLLSISAQFYSDPEYIETVKNDSFFPIPKVDSAIIKIQNISPKLPEVKNVDLFFQIVKAGFSQKRKKLHNSIAGNLRMDEKDVSKILKSAGIDSNRRAEALSLKEWEKVYKKWKV